MATVKRLCEYKEENFTLMEELAMERQKEVLIVCYSECQSGALSLVQIVEILY